MGLLTNSLQLCPVKLNPVLAIQQQMPKWNAVLMATATKARRSISSHGHDSRYVEKAKYSHVYCTECSFIFRTRMNIFALFMGQVSSNSKTLLHLQPEVSKSLQQSENISIKSSRFRESWCERVVMMSQIHAKWKISSRRTFIQKALDRINCFHDDNEILSLWSRTQLWKGLLFGLWIKGPWDSQRFY